MYKDALISEDATATLIIAKIISSSNKEQAVSMIKSKITKINLPDTVKIYYGGEAILDTEIASMIFKDLSFLGPLAFLMIAVIIFFSFRSLKKLMIPLLTVLIAIVWTFGIISLLHYELTMITSIVPVILLAVGSGWPIHIINRLNMETDPDRISALKKALIYVAMPVSVAATAAIIGFLTFVFSSYLTMIQQFGAFSAMGIFIALLLSLTFAPALIASWNIKRKSTGSHMKPDKKSFLDSFLTKSTDTMLHRPLFIIIPWIIVFLFSFIGMTKIEYKADIIGFFKRNSDVRKSDKILKDKFSGSQVVYVSVKGDIQSPEVLNAMKQTQHFLENNMNIKYTQSVADLVEEMNNAMGEGKKIPDEKAKIEQLWFLLDGQEIMTQLVNDSLNEGLIQANMTNTSDIKVLTQLIESLNQYIKQFRSCKMEICGMPMILIKIDESIVQSQRQSLCLAIILAFILVTIVLKSLKKGLYSIVPMISSVIVLYGFMGWAGIPFDVATVLVGSIGVGVGDYVIHILSGYNFYYKRNNDNSSALTESLKISGKAVIINVLSVSVGFVVLIFSNLIPLQGFGTIVPVTLLSSALATVTLLPIIIKATSKPKKSNRIGQLEEVFEETEC